MKKHNAIILCIAAVLGFLMYQYQRSFFLDVEECLAIAVFTFFVGFIAMLVEYKIVKFIINFIKGRTKSHYKFGTSSYEASSKTQKHSEPKKPGNLEKLLEETISAGEWTGSVWSPTPPNLDDLERLLKAGADVNYVQSDKSDKHGYLRYGTPSRARAAVTKAPILMALLFYMHNCFKKKLVVMPEANAAMSAFQDHHGYRNAIEFLVKNGADVNCKCDVIITSPPYVDDPKYKVGTKLFSITPISFISRYYYGYGTPSNRNCVPNTLYYDSIFLACYSDKRYINNASPLIRSRSIRSDIISSLIRCFVDAGAEFTLQDVIEAAGDADVASTWADICIGSDKFQKISVSERGKTYRKIIDNWLMYGDAAAKLVNAGADIETQCAERDNPLRPRLAKGGTLLHLIADEGGSITLAQALIDNGVDINAKDKAGQTALVIAAQRNRIEYAKWLIEHGADKEDVATCAASMEMFKLLNS